MNGKRLAILSSSIVTVLTAVLAASNEPAREAVTRIVSQIQRADYQGNQIAMQKGYDELTPFSENKELASRVRYWRGFAMWRRAINGFNDSIDPNELEQDLNQALDEFREATAKDPPFVDAKIGMVSCLGYLAFMNRQDVTRTQQIIRQMLPLVKEAKAAAPDNPRLLWVLGSILWNTPPERGGGQDKAIENSEKALELYRKNKPTSGNPLEPSWGEPELLMSLAWCQLNEVKPDLNAAERNARSALELVPHWHYIRDTLLPQILAAKAGAGGH